MAGEEQQGYSEERQQNASSHVQEGQVAVETSAKAAYSLGAAQTSDVWGGEEGPSSLRVSAGDMFNAISDVLSKENALIAEFEAKMRLAMESIVAAEEDNEQSFRAVSQALAGVAASAQAGELASSLQKAGFLPKEEATQGSGGASASSGGETEGTQNAQTPTSGPDEF